MVRAHCSSDGCVGKASNIHRQSKDEVSFHADLFVAIDQLRAAVFFGGNLPIGDSRLLHDCSQFP